MSFDWKSFWDARAQQDDISGMARGEKTSVTDVIKSFIETCRRLELKHSDKVLDVGCAVGAFCLTISPFVKQVVGVDFSSLMVERASKNFATCENCSAIVADIRRLPYKGKEFDKINCWSVIQYLGTKEEGVVAILELYRVLKPGGILLLGGTPNAQVKEAYIEGIWQLNKSQEEKERIAKRNEAAIWYDPDELLSLLSEKLGMHATRLENEAGKWHEHLHFDLVVRKP